MRKLFFYLLLAIFCFADTEITSLPATLNSNGETYYLSGDLTCVSGDALTISAANVTITGNNHTILYASGDCISLSQNITTLTVNGLNGRQGVSGGRFFTNESLRNIGVTTITDCDVVSDSVASEIIHMENVGAECSLYISSCSLYVNTPTHAEAHGIWYHASGSGSISGRIHHNKIHLGDSISEGRSAGISMQAIAGSMTVDSNNIWLYNYYQGEGILSYFHGEKTIYDNNLYLYCNQCRGIMLDGNSDNSLVRKNSIYADIKLVPDASGGTHCIRVRFGSDDNLVDSNEITIVNGNTNGIVIGGSDPSSADRQVPKRDTLQYNVITSTSAGIIIYDGTLDTIVFKGNKITTTGSTSPYLIVTEDTSCYNIKIIADTLTYSSTWMIDFANLYGIPGDPIAFYNMDVNSSNADLDSGDFYVDLDTTLDEGQLYVWDLPGFTIVDTAYGRTTKSTSWIVTCKEWVQDFWIKVSRGGSWVSVDSSIGLAVSANDTLTNTLTCDSIILVGISKKE